VAHKKLFGIKILETLGDGFFIPPNTFLGIAKLHIFRTKILNTLGDALKLLLEML
jgi:hypothetical protein